MSILVISLYSVRFPHHNQPFSALWFTYVPPVEIQTRYTVKHNTSVLHIAVHQNHHRAPLLQRFKKRKYTCKTQMLHQWALTNTCLFIKIIHICHVCSHFLLCVKYLYVFRSKRICKGKDKAVPLQAGSAPEGSRKLRFPDYMTTARMVVMFSALRTGRVYPQEMLLVLISVVGRVAQSV